MLQALATTPTHPFSHKNLIEAYNKLEFTKRSQTLELFLAIGSPLPKGNPPYDSSMFPDRTRHITTILSYLHGCHSDQSINEAILGLLSMFSSDSKPTVIYDFGHFIAETIHDKFVKFNTKEVFKCASILVYMFIYFQGDKFPFSLQILDEEGSPHSVIFWASMGMKEKQEFTYKKFIELFIHLTLSLMSSTPLPMINEEIVKEIQCIYQAGT